MININKRIVIIIIVMISMVLSLRKQDIGVNDWVYENIGKIQQLSFSKPIHSKKFSQALTYLNSQLGIFGHLNKNTGEITKRESLGNGEIIIEYNDQQLIILTNYKQIIRYNKYTMNKFIDNRVMNQNFYSINSYVIYQDKLYISDNRTIKQYQTNIKIINGTSISTSEGFSILKIFVSRKEEQSILYAALYSKQQQKLCISKVLNPSQKRCISASPGFNLYLKALDKSGEKYQYYELNEEHSKIIHSQPSSFYQTGIILQNGNILNAKNSKNVQNLKIEAYIKSTKQRVYVQWQDNSQLVQLYTGKQKGRGDKIATIDIESRKTKIKRIWVNKQTDLEIVIQFQDLQLVFFTKKQSIYKELWRREQSLAYIKRAVFLKYEGYADHLNNPYHLDVVDQEYMSLSLLEKIQQIPQKMIKRIKIQIEDICIFWRQKISKLMELGSNTISMTEILDIKNSLKFNMDEDEQKRHGLRKCIIAITSYNTIISIDTKTSVINWKKNYGEGYQFIYQIKLYQEYQQQIAIAFYFDHKINQTYLIHIHQDGNLTQLATFPTKTKPIVFKISHHSVLIKSGEDIYRYDINTKLVGLQKQYHFYSIEDKKVVGWKVFENKAMKTWSLQVPQSQKIIKSASVYRSQPSSTIPLVNNNNKVIFKNVDFSNLAVLTLEQYLHQTQKSVKSAYRLHLYMINGLTGTIQFSQYQTLINPNLPINLFYDEHNAIVSYYSSRNRVCEFWTIQAFQIPQESQLLTKKYEPYVQKQDIVFRSKVYGIVLPIKHVFVSESKHALLRRNILIVTRENKIYTLSRELISTRRPKHPQSNPTLTQLQFTSPKYLPDDYILPINPLSYLSHNRKMIDLRNIGFSSSDMESTIFIISHGIDIFLMRTAPDKPFDRLDESFNYLQILVVILIVTIAAVFLRSKVKKARLQKIHME